MEETLNVTDEIKKTTEVKKKGGLYCSFCGKDQKEVRALIAGPSVYICSECIGLCVDIIRENQKWPHYCVPKGGIQAHIASIEASLLYLKSASDGIEKLIKEPASTTEEEKQS